MDIVSERDPLIAVNDAAEQLGLLPSRVRALAQAGLLPGRKVGRRWIFLKSEVQDFAQKHRAAGRPLSASKSLGLLFELSGEHANWLDRIDRWKVLHSRSARDLDDLVARSKGRAERVERRVHPSDLPRILSEPGVVRGGVSAAGEYGIDLVAPGVIEVYVEWAHVDNLVRQFSLVRSDEPNVVLHMVRIPGALSRAVMPLGVVIVDLLESGEPRAMAAARRAWRRLRHP